jgi:hypothetical protein
MLVSITAKYRDGGDVGWDYLRRTVDAISHDGSHCQLDGHIFLSNRERDAWGVIDSGPGRPTMLIHLPPRDRNLFQNSVLAMRKMAEIAASLGDGWFLMLQDDVICCKRAMDRITRDAMDLLADPNTGMVSYYTPWEAKETNRYRLERYPKRDIYGTLAMLWRVEAAAVFLDSQHVRAHTGHKGWDMVIKRWAMNQDVYGAKRSVPCLFQHIGVHSTCGHVGGQLMTMNYAGNDFNAMG